MAKIRLRVRYDHRVIPRGVLAMVLLAVGLLATLVLKRVYATVPSSTTSPSTTSGMRQFYLSNTVVKGDGAATACAEGYHFASLWELADPSNLKYNPSLGLTSDDSGAGPPTQVVGRLGSTYSAQGWIRTGYNASTVAIVGQGNCDAWTSQSGTDSGTVANLPSNWSANEQDIGVWNAEVKACNSTAWVWCVQDRGLSFVFLPLVIKD